MDILVIVGFLGFIFTALQLLPQVYKTLKTNSAKDLSFWMLIIIFGGALTWLMYSFLINDIYIFIANFLNLIFALILIYKKLF